MRVRVLAKATEDRARGVVPTPENTEMPQAMRRFHEEPTKAGIWLAADGLTPSSLWASVLRSTA